MLCQNFTQIRHQSPSHNGEFGSEAQENLGSLTTGLLVGFKISTWDKSFCRALAPQHPFPTKHSSEPPVSAQPPPAPFSSRLGWKPRWHLEDWICLGEPPKSYWHPLRVSPIFHCSISGVGTLKQAVSSRFHIPGASVAFQNYPSLQITPSRSVRLCQQPHARVKIKLIQKKAFNTLLSVFSTLQLITGN